MIFCSLKFLRNTKNIFEFTQVLYSKFYQLIYSLLLNPWLTVRFNACFYTKGLSDDESKNNTKLSLVFVASKQSKGSSLF